MSDDGPPVILAVDDDQKILETYEIWLGQDYDLRTAESGREALEILDEEVQVVLLDRMMPGLSGDDVLDRIRERDLNCRVAMVTAVEPGLDIAEMPFDAYVTKALEREKVLNTVEQLANRAAYDRLLTEHYAVAEKLATLEEHTPESDLAASESYQNLRERFQRLDQELADTTDAFDRSALVSSFDDLEATRSASDGPGDDDTEDSAETHGDSNT